MLPGTEGFAELCLPKPHAIWNWTQQEVILRLISTCSTNRSRAKLEEHSGKTAKTENFPVGSRMLPVQLRPYALAFYHFARTVDDIADSGRLAANEKVRRLDCFAEVLFGNDSTTPECDKAHAMRRSLAETGVTPKHCTDIVDSCRQDSHKLRFADWGELVDQMNLSASPIGRYLIDLHREPITAYPMSDALCHALQLLDHLQDVGEDYRANNRIYIPEKWMAAAGVDTAELGLTRTSKPVRMVINRCLDAVDDMFVVAAGLHDQLHNLRFTMEVVTMIAVAKNSQVK